MEFEKLKAANTAVLYDIENIKDMKDLESILDLIENLVEGRAFFNCAYTDWGISGMEKKKTLLQSHGVIPTQVITYGRNVQKNSSDIALCVDAMELLFDPDIKNFIIVTGDGGFTSLITKIKKHKRHVEIISVSDAFSEMIRGFADKVHTVHNTPNALISQLIASAAADATNTATSDVQKIDNYNPNDFSSEVDKHYFKVIWAISKQDPTLKGAMGAIFKATAVKQKIKDGGMLYSILEYALSTSGHKKKSIRDSFNSQIAFSRGYATILAENGAMLIVKKDVNDAEFFIDVARKYLDRKRCVVSKGDSSARIIQHIGSNYTTLNKRNRAKIAEETTKTLRTRAVFVESILTIMLDLGLYNFSQSLPFKIFRKLSYVAGANDRAIAFDIGKSIFGIRPEELHLNSAEQASLLKYQNAKREARTSLEVDM